jgi:hypothetical protein
MPQGASIQLEIHKKIAQSPLFRAVNLPHWSHLDDMGSGSLH